MSIQVGWSNSAQSVITYKFQNQWTWVDFEEALETGFGLVESVSHPVDVIFDMTTCKQIPDGGMLYWRKMLRVSPPNQQIVTFVTKTPVIHTTVKLFCDVNKSCKHRIALYSSMDSAVSMILQMQNARRALSA